MMTSLIGMMMASSLISVSLCSTCCCVQSSINSAGRWWNADDQQTFVACDLHQRAFICEHTQLAKQRLLALIQTLQLQNNSGVWGAELPSWTRPGHTSPLEKPKEALALALASE